MKYLFLITVCLLLGCEKRVVDPEIEAAREWLRSEEGQNAVENHFAEVSQIEPVAIDQLVPCENWAIKRTDFRGSSPPMKSEWFALYAEEKIGDSGRLFFIKIDEYGFTFAFFFPFGPLVTESEFKDFGDPLSMDKFGELADALTSHE